MIQIALLAFSLFAGWVVAAVAQEDGTRVVGRYDERVAHVEIIAILFNNKVDHFAGSGLLIADRYVLTNNHVVPPLEGYKTATIGIRLKTRLSDPIYVAAVKRDPDHDLALLELEKMPADDVVGGKRCPMPVADADSQVPVGSWVYLLGYPANQDQSVTPGLISNHGSAGDSRWQTSVSMNHGNSGGPAFRADGTLAGIAVGGVTELLPAAEGQDPIKIDGISFIIPAEQIRVSTLYPMIEKISAEHRCWQDGPDVSPAPGKFPTPDLINVSQPFRETKFDHPTLFDDTRSYHLPFPAQEGYQITRCSVGILSANHNSDPICRVAPDGSSASLIFDLTSGPLFNRWRGWLAGTVELGQQRR